MLKAQEYIFKYIVQSRRLFSLATGGQNEEEFRRCIQELLLSVRFFLSQESKGSGALSQSQVSSRPRCRVAEQGAQRGRRTRQPQGSPSSSRDLWLRRVNRLNNKQTNKNNNPKKLWSPGPVPAETAPAPSGSPWLCPVRPRSCHLCGRSAPRRGHRGSPVPRFPEAGRSTGFPGTPREEEE